MTIKINDKVVSANAGTTILETARMNGVLIPTLCYLKELNEIAACRLCLVEVKGCDRLVAACNTEVREGMEVFTATPRVLAARKANLALMLSEHDSHCTTCSRNGNCTLQTLAANFGLVQEVYDRRLPRDFSQYAPSVPLVRTDSKCIKCQRCVQVCEQVQGLGVWALLGSGSNTRIGVRDGARLEMAKCTYCGQCVTHCPVGALRERDDTERFVAALADPDKIVVLQVAPAVRAAWGEGLGLSPRLATERRMAAAFRRLGVDYVFDTNFAADLTIMEEGNELLQRLKDPSFKRPLFTSCCPGWVRFLKHEYPDMVAQLSTAKSPQQMFGAVAKSYFAERIGKPRSQIFCVSVMPCTAKKYECTIDDTVDLVLTTREVDRLLRRFSVNVALLPEENFDSPLGTGTGAGVIFGRTGGVMEAAIRTIGGEGVRTKVVSGLANARALIEAIRAGRAEYDFVEVMACPGGCAGGGGQPIFDGCELADERGDALNRLDAANPIRESHENPEIKTLYHDYLGAPLSAKAHELLHTNHSQWRL